ncbi:putative guanosine-3',5'-bis(diphosphate) 3'-pyrophosphohydrolase [Halomicronema hongdechloris C2206]|uniref:Guanosine-3',5'-bis(Diphosphate) 3'-pyrophosphohydrolase n=1 Tax=Halomicronema hongdechloris C2206 TaxID=1641165 RepID=A0A1Z3HM23_9CYAN|nr:bifunctional (p)ppGpp synthetase/guanosine-3',5'-bis(diphosphate) 3'-pyrophosphohydrolase [Halomicronema hongdechloris]ASC71326.1 putative guanosine-3',5'-bis(diphosphate) 3'-pyrophosphohydrolase [Halomicronema hongdechloris C2206]
MNVAKTLDSTADPTLADTLDLPDDCNLPNWLQTCLLSQSPDLEDESEEIRENKSNNRLVCQAFQFAYTLHKGQRRASGEPYICHPIAVASLLRDLGGDSAMIAAGFLHDVVEDTDVTPDEIEAHFGQEVRQLVEGVTKLSKFNFQSKTERQAENFRRMFLAMAQDIRVIVVKLADRLHNMRTLEHLSDEKRRRIAQETLEIFAPLANRLGIGRFKWELEDLSFKYLKTDAYNKMREHVVEKRGDREARLKQIAQTLRQRLQQAGIKVIEVSSRPKHLYGIYCKMERQHKDFHEIYDVAAIRLIVGTKEECYRTLAVVHDAFRPIPGRFKDYIGLPKPNRYQSLHTVVIGTSGRPIEVQIRTLEMHHVAEYGIAAHWKYKETGSSSNTPVTTDDEKFTWLRQLLEWQNDLKDAQEFLENVKGNLFDEDVYVFTPNGDVISLNRGATPVDFAYRIHTEVGNHCAGARVNDRIVTLDTPLETGDIVEIITQKNSHPSLDWLNFVVTAGARNRIRQWYKRSHRDENVARGRDMLEKELGKNGFDALLKSAPAQAAAERCNYSTVEDLLAGLGYGEVTLNLVVNRLREAVKAQQPIEADSKEAPDPEQLIAEAISSPSLKSKVSPSTSPILGVEGLLHHIAGCCNPLPGEPIIGVVSLGSRGIAIHRQGCPNVESIPGDRLIPVSWNQAESNGNNRQTYPVQVKIEVIDRVGVLKDILSHLSDLQINVYKAQVKTFPGQTAEIDLGLDVRDHAHLDRTFNQIRKMTDVLRLRRVSEADG